VYEHFFGLKEKPFQLVPNPDYFFLSRSHEEAIAHLNYAIAHGDGFVEITGEVGTGKTTLCRAFLQDLEARCEVAYIFNPRLNSLELLRSINDEFGISSEADNSKDLIDTLNTFLMEKKSHGRNALLLIDEAQNLDKEVLEQLRLLSNLETDTSKLLQIILVGQPELRKMLDSYQLRQLRQRITLSWYLTPLNRKETRAYIRHRVNIAAQKSGDKFTMWACHWIYNYSGGIPRLINIACDRALLTAFGFNRPKVTGPIARSALKELRTRGGDTRRVFTKGRVLAAFIVLVCLVLMGFFLFKDSVFPGAGRNSPDRNGIERKNSRTEAVKERASVVPRGEPVRAIAPVLETSRDFAAFLENLADRPSRFFALKAALSQWETLPHLNRYLDHIAADNDFFQFVATQEEFQVLAVNNDWELIKKLNLPAVLAFLPPGAVSPRYLTLVQLSSAEIRLKGGEKDETLKVNPAVVQSYWTGNAYIPWKNFFNYEGAIPIDAPKEAVLTLKLLLRDLGFKDLELDDVYDDATRETIKKIQEKHGIAIDGIVGVRTKIVLYNEKKELRIPHIRVWNETPGERSITAQQ
jgi:general secretion pathway protein A